MKITKIYLNSINFCKPEEKDKLPIAIGHFLIGNTNEGNDLPTTTRIVGVARFDKKLPFQSVLDAMIEDAQCRLNLSSSISKDEWLNLLAEMDEPELPHDFSNLFNSSEEEK